MKPATAKHRARSRQINKCTPNRRAAVQRQADKTQESVILHRRKAGYQKQRRERERESNKRIHPNPFTKVYKVQNILDG